MNPKDYGKDDVFWALRPFLVMGGLSMVYAATLYLVAKPPNQPLTTLLPVEFRLNILYYLYLRALQLFFPFHAMSLMIANSLLMWMISIGVFRVGWGLSQPRYRLLGATAAMLLFQLNPLVVILPLTLGFLGGYLLAPLLLLFFVSVMLSVENWSVFMRAIVLAVVWSLFLWVHLPTASFVLVALVPWVLYNRRPLPALGIFLTIFLLGTVLFSVTWTLGCAAARRWAMIQSPLTTMWLLWTYWQQGLALVGTGGPGLLNGRIANLAAWLSPFMFFSGVWVCVESLRRMFKERRASTTDLVALISLVVFGVVLGTYGKDTLPGAWYLLILAALWSPMIARTLAKKENLYTRGSRWTFLVGFVVCGLTLWVLRQNTGLLLPDAAMLWKLLLVLFITGGVAHAVLQKHPLTVQIRLQALLTGASLAYFLMIDGFLLR